MLSIQDAATGGIRHLQPNCSNIHLNPVLAANNTLATIIIVARVLFSGGCRGYLARKLPHHYR